MPRTLKDPHPTPDDSLRAGLASNGGLQAWLYSQGKALGSCPVLWRLGRQGGRKEVTETYEVAPGPCPGLTTGPKPTHIPLVSVVFWS